jgi:hypothetical protein
MGKARVATGVLLVTLVTAAMGYTIASAVLTHLVAWIDEIGEEVRSLLVKVAPYAAQIQYRAPGQVPGREVLRDQLARV